jgi:hypothetical protein
MIPDAPRDSHESRYAWRGAMLACLLQAIGMPVDLLLTADLPGVRLWPPLMSSATGVLLAIVLLAYRRRPNVRLATTVFLVNTGVILVALWITSGAYAAAPGQWIPFQANKIGALAAAVLAPGLVTGLISISGFVGMVLLRYLTLPGDQQANLPISEPWAILIYAVFAVAILGYRVHSVSLSRRMFRMRTESVATQRMARTFLALRDFTNTPLQTIELATNIVRKRCPDLGPMLDRIDRSIDRLYRLNHALSMYESHLEWTDDEVSPDASGLVTRSL